MTRRILFCTIGATPQVVTETVWALRNQRNPPWEPDEIHLVTTTFALDRIRQELQSPSGHLAALLGGRIPPVSIHLPCRDGSVITFDPWRAEGDWGESADAITLPAEESALRDVNSATDAASMGSLIFRLIARFTQKDDTELHVSLAGGRKTMSAHALLAASHFGRWQDEVSHVLVSPPFEDTRTFWYPGQTDPVTVRVSRPGAKPPFVEEQRSAEEAEVTLIPTAVPLLRYEVKGADKIEHVDLTKIPEGRNLALRLQESKQVVIDTASNGIVAAGITTILGPKSFALYRLMAIAQRDGWPGVGPDGEGSGHKGWLSTERLAVGKAPDGTDIRSILLKYLQQSVRVIDGEYRLVDPATGRVHPDLAEGLKEWYRDAIMVSDLRDKLAKIQIWFGSCTRLTEDLEKGFGNPAAWILGPTVRTERQSRPILPGGRVNPNGWTCFGLTLPPEWIVIC